MFKKIILLILILISSYSFFEVGVFASNAPGVICEGLPGCSSSPSITNVFNKIISELIKFVALFAVLALIGSGIFFLISGGDEEKVKKAKLWITWSLVGVILSISAWGIINMLNSIKVGT